MINFIQRNAIYFILIQAIFALVGSLYFSEIKQYPPCVLCWWQRIFMYPLIPIIIIGLITKETKIYLYTLTMSIIGILFSIYHNLLYVGFIKNEEFCSTGISCTSKYVEYFGFITIPFMAFLGFLFIIILSLINMNYINKIKNNK